MDLALLLELECVWLRGCASEPRGQLESLDLGLLATGEAVDGGRGKASKIAIMGMG